LNAPQGGSSDHGGHPAGDNGSPAHGRARRDATASRRPDRRRAPPAASATVVGARPCASGARCKDGPIPGPGVGARARSGWSPCARCIAPAGWQGRCVATVRGRPRGPCPPRCSARASSPQRPGRHGPPPSAPAPPRGPRRRDDTGRLGAGRGARPAVGRRGAQRRNDRGDPAQQPRRGRDPVDGQPGMSTGAGSLVAATTACRTRTAAPAQRRARRRRLAGAGADGWARTSRGAPPASQRVMSTSVFHAITRNDRRLLDLALASPAMEEQ
jgi:hypothetical protein